MARGKVSMTPDEALRPLGALPHRRVLVVEDDEDISDSMSSILQDAGYRVDACGNGKDALDHLQREPTDAVVLDLMMPVMNGWEFVTAKKADPSIAEIPVVAISADSSAKATAIRADTYVPNDQIDRRSLTKPQRTVRPCRRQLRGRSNARLREARESWSEGPDRLRRSERHHDLSAERCPNKPSSRIMAQFRREREGGAYAASASMCADGR